MTISRFPELKDSFDAFAKLNNLYGHEKKLICCAAVALIPVHVLTFRTLVLYSQLMKYAIRKNYFLWAVLSVLVSASLCFWSDLHLGKDRVIHNVAPFF